MHLNMQCPHTNPTAAFELRTFLAVRLFLLATKVEFAVRLGGTETNFQSGKVQSVKERPVNVFKYMSER